MVYCIRCYVECFTDIISFNSYCNLKEAANTLPILQKRKVKVREEKYLSTYKQKKQNSSPDLSASKSVLLVMHSSVPSWGDGRCVYKKDNDQRAGVHRDKQDEVSRSS